MKIKLKTSLRGVTLIELLVTMSILMIISVVIIDIYLKTQNNFRIQLSKTNLETTTRMSLDTINDSVKSASSVLSTYTAPNNTTYNTSPTCLILKIPSIDNNKNAIADTYDYFIFQVDPNNSYIIQELSYTDTASSRNDITRNIAKNLSNLEFKYYDSSNIEITTGYENTSNIKTAIISSEVINDTINSIELNTESKLRNK